MSAIQTVQTVEISVYLVGFHENVRCWEVSVRGDFAVLYNCVNVPTKYLDALSGIKNQWRCQKFQIIWARIILFSFGQRFRL